MSIQDQIRNRLRRRGRGAVFSASDFADLGTRHAVTQALSRLARSSVIRRLDRGFYDFPRKSARVGFRSPHPDEVAQAAARRSGHQLQATGAVAAYALGLSDQVPARAVYYTSGPSRTLKAGNRTVVLRHAGPRALRGVGTISGDVYQALRFIGRDAIDDRLIDHLRDRLSGPHKQRILQQLASYPGWAQDVMRRVAHVPSEVGAARQPAYHGSNPHQKAPAVSINPSEATIPQEIQDYFWDYDLGQLSWDGARPTIVLRLLQAGGLQAMLWLRTRLTDDEIRDFIVRRRGRGLDPRRLRFWAVMVGLPKHQVDEWIAAIQANPWHQRTRS